MLILIIYLSRPCGCRCKIKETQKTCCQKEEKEEEER